MIKIFCFLTGCLTLLVLMCGTAEAWDPPLVVTINYIKFNHTTGSSTNDALDIKEDYSTTITAPEWTSDVSKEFAYIMNQSSRTIKATFTHNQDIGEIETMHIQATYTGANPIGNVPLTEVNFNGAITSNETTFTTSGTVPNSVNNYDYYWHWTVNKVNGVTQSPGISIGNTHHICYSLLRQPISGRVFSDGKTWSIILKKACSWAQGENTDVNVATEITEDLYYAQDQDGDIDYDLDKQWGESGVIEVENFLNALENSSNVTANCTDLAQLFNTFTEAVGCTTMYMNIQNTNWPNIFGTFFDPPGNAESTEYRELTSHSHGFRNARVFDSCVKFGSGIPVNMLQVDYEDSLIVTYSVNYHQPLFASPY